MAGKYIVTKYDQANDIVIRLYKSLTLKEAQRLCENKVDRKSNTLLSPKVRKGKHIFIYQVFDKTELIETWSITEI